MKLKNVSVFGEPHKVQNALYMINLIKSTMDQEFAQFKLQWEYQDLRMRHHPQSIRSNFLNAMGFRIGERLKEMAQAEREQVKEQSSTGTDLIVLADNKRVQSMAQKCFLASARVQVATLALAVLVLLAALLVIGQALVAV